MRVDRKQHQATLVAIDSIAQAPGAFFKEPGLSDHVDRLPETRSITVDYRANYGRDRQ